MAREGLLIDFGDDALAPLTISSVQVAEQAREEVATVSAPVAPSAAPPVVVEEEGPVGTLRAMFPAYNRDVLATIYGVCDSNLEAAVQQLLEMSEPAAAATTGTADGSAPAEAQSDEALALALFKQFASDLENQLASDGYTGPIPPEVRNDPVRYEAFVRQQFEREAAREGSTLNTRIHRWGGGGGGQIASAGRPTTTSVVERVRKMRLGALKGVRGSRLGGRWQTVDVEDGHTSLLGGNDGSGSDATSRPREVVLEDGVVRVRK